MKIIKEGHIESKVYRFTCDKCGCVFKANEDEIDYVMSPTNVRYARFTCPCCFNLVTKYEH